MYLVDREFFFGGGYLQFNMTSPSFDPVLSMLAGLHHVQLGTMESDKQWKVSSYQLSSKCL